TFIDYFEDLLLFITPQYNKIFILGDFNVDCLKDNRLDKCVGSYDFEQLINEPTRIIQNSSTLNDLIMCNNFQLVVNSGTINADLKSDHNLVHCVITCYTNKKWNPI
ncbi:hypothetical protein BDFB_012396, partial [Asbolus verrucosus]